MMMTRRARRRVEELELENALMREVVEVVKKDPGADLLVEQGEDPVDRPVEAGVFAQLDDMFAAIAPSSYHHARLGVDKYAGLRQRWPPGFADSKGRFRIKAVLQDRRIEKVVRRIINGKGSPQV